MTGLAEPVRHAAAAPDQKRSDVREQPGVGAELTPATADRDGERDSLAARAGGADDLYELNGAMACESLLALFRGEIPKDPVNREVIETEELQDRLRGMAARWEAMRG